MFPLIDGRSRGSVSNEQIDCKCCSMSPKTSVASSQQTTSSHPEQVNRSVLMFLPPAMADCPVPFDGNLRLSTVPIFARLSDRKDKTTSFSFGRRIADNRQRAHCKSVLDLAQVIIVAVNLFAFTVTIFLLSVIVRLRHFDALLLILNRHTEIRRS